MENAKVISIDNRTDTLQAAVIERPDGVEVLVVLDGPLGMLEAAWRQSPGGVVVPGHANGVVATSAGPRPFSIDPTKLIAELQRGAMLDIMRKEFIGIYEAHNHCG